MKILYLTHNGITDHIGQSQIAPYCMGLAELGYRIHIVSAEKPGREALKERYRSLFAARGIKWSYVTYHNRPPLVSQFYDMVRMRRLALRTGYNFNADELKFSAGAGLYAALGTTQGTLDYAYTDVLARAVSVDSRGILEALRRVYRVEKLVGELSTGQRTE